MSDYDFDLITIGGGSGGVRASRFAASTYGAKTAVVENMRIGGTCVMRGCVPKKLLVYGAHFAEDFEDAGGYGWDVGAPSFDWQKLIANKNVELDRLEGVYHRLLRDAGVAELTGTGRVVDAHTVAVDGPDGTETYTAKHILIATGGWPSLPQIPGIEHAITSNEALDLETLPDSIANAEFGIGQIPPEAHAMQGQEQAEAATTPQPDVFIIHAHASLFANSQWMHPVRSAMRTSPNGTDFQPSTSIHCLFRRLSETAIFVPSCWANSDTRYSSSIQRYSTSCGSRLPSWRCLAVRAWYCSQ